MRKQLSYAARQAVAFESLRAMNRTAAAAKSTDDAFFRRSDPRDSGDQKLFDQCIADEKAAEEQRLEPVKRAQAALNKTIVSALAEETLTCEHDRYLAESCPQTDRDQTSEGIRRAWDAFRDVLLPVTITDEGIKLIQHVATINPKVDYESTSPLTFSIVWARLVSLGLAQEGIHFIQPTVRKQQPEPQELSQGLSDREQCEAEYVGVVMPLMAQWETSLLENWGVVLTPQLRATVASIMEKNNLNPAQTSAYDFCRVRLALRGLITTSKRDDGRPLTNDEAVCDAIDRNNVDLGSVAGKQWYGTMMDRIIHSKQE